MIDNANAIVEKYKSLETQMLENASSLDHKEYALLSKELNDLKDTYEIAVLYKKQISLFREAKQILDTISDDDMISLAKEQLHNSQEQLPELEQKLKLALLPKDPNDDKDVYVEIRPAAGGNESSLFAQELMRMYMMYAQSKKWKTEVIDVQDSDVGGIKFCVIKIAGEKVYSYMKYESGVHRVQRIPETESSGRIHTSTVTVAIMPEADDVDVSLEPHDIVMDTYAASSAGGQNANKNQTGVRLHHKPSGIIVTIGDSKSQLQNKEKAFAILKAKLYQIEYEAKQKEEQELRGSQIGTGDRSEKIRTYNFPQDRITDHRIQESWSNISQVLAGDLDDILYSLIVYYQTKLLEELG